MNLRTEFYKAINQLNLIAYLFVSKQAASILRLRLSTLLSFQYNGPDLVLINVSTNGRSIAMKKML